MKVENYFTEKKIYFTDQKMYFVEISLNSLTYTEVRLAFRAKPLGFNLKKTTGQNIIHKIKISQQNIQTDSCEHEAFQIIYAQLPVTRFRAQQLAKSV